MDSVFPSDRWASFGKYFSCELFVFERTGRATIVNGNFLTTRLKGISGDYLGQARIIHPRRQNFGAGSICHGAIYRYAEL